MIYVSSRRSALAVLCLLFRTCSASLQSALRASRVSDLTLSGDRAAELLRCATAASGDQTCFDTPAPETFTVEFDLHSGKSFRIDVNTAWAPEFAQRFLQLVNL